MGKLGTQRDWVTCERQLKLNDLLNDSFIQSKHPVLVSFSVTVTTCLGQSIYKERRFIFAQEFRRFSPWSVKLISFGPVASEHIVVRNTWQWNPIHLLARWKRQRKRTWSHSPLQGQVHNGLHPPTRPHLLQVPLPPRSAFWDQDYNTRTFQRCLVSKVLQTVWYYNTLILWIRVPWILWTYICQETVFVIRIYMIKTEVQKG
jgi:hypothetical protein